MNLYFLYALTAFPTPQPYMFNGHNTTYLGKVMEIKSFMDSVRQRQQQHCSRKDYTALSLFLSKH